MTYDWHELAQRYRETNDIGEAKAIIKLMHEIAEIRKLEKECSVGYKREKKHEHQRWVSLRQKQAEAKVADYQI